MGPVIHREFNKTTALATGGSGLFWWGGWDLNPRSSVPETDILDQAVPTEARSGPPPRTHDGETVSDKIIPEARFCHKFLTLKY